MTLWRLQPPPGKPFPVRPLENTMPNLPPEKGISRTLSYHLTSRPAQTNMFYKKELFRIYCKHYFAGGHVSFNDIYLLYRPFSGAISTCLMEHPSNCVRLVDASRPFWASAICKCKRYPQATSPVEIFCEIFLQMCRLRGNAQDFRLHRFFKNGHQMFDSDVLIVWTIWYYVYIYTSYIYIYRIYIIYIVYIYICLKKSEKSVLCFSFFLHLFQIAKPSIHHRARVAVQRFPLEVAAVLLPCAQQQHDAVAWHAANAANPSAVFFAPSSMAWWRKEVFWGKKGVEALEAPMVDEDIERSTFWWPGNFANH